jgi:RNA polymerase sigma-70 factor (ECF subfamily)
VAARRLLAPARLEEHLDRLYRAALALCASRPDAEDLVQETCARVMSRPRLVRSGSELAYLLAALHHTFVSLRRRDRRRPAAAPLDEERDPVDERLWANPAATSETQLLYAAIAALPDEFRMALVAVDVVGLSYREAARALRVPEATITTRLFRARQRVAAELVGDRPASPPRAERQERGAGHTLS